MARFFSCLVILAAMVGCKGGIGPSYVGSGEHLQQIEDRSTFAQKAIAGAIPHTDAVGKDDLKAADTQLVEIKNQVVEERQEKAAANEAIKNLKEDNSKQAERISEYQARWTGDKLQHVIKLVIFGLAGVAVTFVVGFILVKLFRASPAGIVGTVVQDVEHVVASNKEKFFGDPK